MGPTRGGGDANTPLKTAIGPPTTMLMRSHEENVSIQFQEVRLEIVPCRLVKTTVLNKPALIAQRVKPSALITRITNPGVAGSIPGAGSSIVRTAPPRCGR